MPLPLTVTRRRYLGGRAGAKRGRASAGLAGAAARAAGCPLRLSQAETAAPSQSHAVLACNVPAKSRFKLSAAPWSPRLHLLTSYRPPHLQRACRLMLPNPIICSAGPLTCSGPAARGMSHSSSQRCGTQKAAASGTQTPRHPAATARALSGRRWRWGGWRFASGARAAWGGAGSCLLPVARCQPHSQPRAYSPSAVSRQLCPCTPCASPRATKSWKVPRSEASSIWPMSCTRTPLCSTRFVVSGVMRTWQAAGLRGFGVDGGRGVGAAARAARDAGRAAARRRCVLLRCQLCRGPRMAGARNHRPTRKTPSEKTRARLLRVRVALRARAPSAAPRGAARAAPSLGGRRRAPRPRPRRPAGRMCGAHLSKDAVMVCVQRQLLRLGALALHHRRALVLCAAFPVLERDVYAARRGLHEPEDVLHGDSPLQERLGPRLGVEQHR